MCVDRSPLARAFADAHPGASFDVGDGVRMHYIDEGSGEPVLMLHGNPTWGFYYRNLIDALAPDHRVIVPDHVGCGRSDKPDGSRYEYTLERRVRDIEALVDHLALEGPITLIVHDWGGMIGFAVAHRRPDLIGRLVVLNTAAFGLPKSKSFPTALRICRDWPVNALLVRGANAFCRIAARVGCTRRPMSPALRDAYVAPYDSWANRIAILRFVQDIPLRPGDRGYDLVAEVEAGLGRFRDRPMLIGWGLRDFVFDRHFLEGWTSRFPEAEVHAYADAGHYILEDAADDLIPRIRAFVAGRVQPVPV